jgi:aspartyl-tRNA(Asn)/glutamyl-tRNA(Gln) amidotransferase subunit A
MTNPSSDLSRRSFLKATLAGTAISLSKVPAMMETDRNSQRTNPVSGSQSDDLSKLSIREAADLIRKKKVSPVELTKACLARIDQANPSLNAFITITRESALQQAGVAESEVMRGNWRGPLHGVPIALKDLFDTAGVRTTAGSDVFKDRIPTEDAEVVRRLKAAGAVLVGKTNMHEFAYGGTSVISYFGAVHNPWDLSHIAGGSSGGSAAAVAAELCYGALGSDTGGSVREPASYCSIVGLKPTYGLVSTRGVIPLSWSLDHVGPMTRTVADAAVMLQSIAGYDSAETTSQQMSVPDYSAALNSKVASLRLGVARDFFFEGLHPEVEAAINEALSVLKRLTADIKEIKISVSADTSVLRAEAYAYHAEFMAKTPELYNSWTLERLRTGAEVTTLSYIGGLREISELRRSTQRLFESVDALITPTAPAPPRTILEANADPPTRSPVLDLRNTAPFDRNGLPTISIPCGFSTRGLPIGLQISGPPGGDAVVLQLAHAYEQATDWHKRRPQLPSRASTATW